MLCDVCKLTHGYSRECEEEKTRRAFREKILALQRKEMDLVARRRQRKREKEAWIIKSKQTIRNQKVAEMKTMIQKKIEKENRERKEAFDAKSAAFEDRKKAQEERKRMELLKKLEIRKERDMKIKQIKLKNAEMFQKKLNSQRGRLEKKLSEASGRRKEIEAELEGRILKEAKERKARSDFCAYKRREIDSDRKNRIMDMYLQRISKVNASFEN